MATPGEEKTEEGGDALVCVYNGRQVDLAVLDGLLQDRGDPIAPVSSRTRAVGFQ